MPTFCCCGNELEEAPRTKITMSPCKCDDPRSFRRKLRTSGIPNHIFEKQWTERTRLGLPMETDFERGIQGSRWK